LTLNPKTREDLSSMLGEACRAGSRIQGVNLSALSRMIEHKPEDMTATVETGMTLAEFQASLRASHQWLPIDPPSPENLSLADLLARDLSGPRRLGYGTIRDYLIGMQVATADGTIIKAGGKVVKNVAGYDLCKLFVGARHSLGIIIEASFKLRPLPECEALLQTSFDSLPAMHSTARAILESAAEPVILDAHNLDGRWNLVTAAAGQREDVAFQIAELQRAAPWSEGSTHYDAEFHDSGVVHKLSVLPSRLDQVLAPMQQTPWVARYANGVVFHKSGALPPPELPNPALMARVKQAYDPRGIFPEYSP
jgi:FAD/FMN-containing dehydrogenase